MNKEHQLQKRLINKLKSMPFKNWEIKEEEVFGASEFRKYFINLKGKYIKIKENTYYQHEGNCHKIEISVSKSKPFKSEYIISLTNSMEGGKKELYNSAKKLFDYLEEEYKNSKEKQRELEIKNKKQKKEEKYTKLLESILD